MATDVKKLLDETIPAALARNVDAARAIDARYQLNITGAGEWFIDTTASGPTCTPGSQDADCTITVEAADFEQLVENPDAALGLFFMGKLQVDGNQMLAVKLTQVLSFS
jgi:alkyl sulfatase BDS1-like metallo-beta-lactamase superfamily hydrolase